MTVRALVRLLISCLSCAAPPQAAMAKVKEVILTPSSSWHVDWGQGSCLLARQFGPADKPLLLSMRTYAPGYDFEMTLAGDQVATIANLDRWRIAYGSGEPIAQRGHQNALTENFGRAVVFSSTLSLVDDGRNNTMEDDTVDPRPYPDEGFEKQLDRIAFSSTSKTVILQTGSMAKAMSALRQCTDNLLKAWGLDPAIQSSLAVPTRVADKGWIHQIQGSFPSVLMIQGKEARVHMRVLVDRAGKPTGCDTVQTFSNTDFKDRACNIVLRSARFKPALDKAGNAVDSFYTTTILYKQP